MEGEAAASCFESFLSEWSKQLDASLADIRRLEAQRDADVALQDVQSHVDLWNELGSAKAKAIEGRHCGRFQRVPLFEFSIIRQVGQLTVAISRPMPGLKSGEPVQ